MEISGPTLGPVEPGFLIPGGRGLVVISGAASVIPNVCTTGAWKSDSIRPINWGDRAAAVARMNRKDVPAQLGPDFSATTAISWRVVGTPWNQDGDSDFK